MTGPKHSVIGMDISASIKRFETTLPERYKIAGGETMLNGVVFEVDDETNKVKNILFYISDTFNNFLDFISNILVG